MIAFGKPKLVNPCEKQGHEVLTRTSIRGEYRHIERSCLRCGEVLSSIDMIGYPKDGIGALMSNLTVIRMEDGDVRIK